MSEISKYEAYKKKLQGICDENNLVFRFRQDVYPITLTIKPVSGFGEQLSMLEMADDNNYTSPDASLVFCLSDGEISWKTSQTFTISEALFAKLKNLFKSITSCWFQYFFRNLIERGVLKAGTMPVIDEDNANDEDEPEDEDESEDVDIPEDAISFDEHLIKEATSIVRAENKVTIGLLQRRLNIGYSKAAQVRDELERLGIIGVIGANGEYEVLPTDVPDEPENDEST